jgi:uncharacterized protein
MDHSANFYIENLKLEKHPEGGYFREVYRADESIARSALPERFLGNRSFSTAIYFLLDGQNISAFHKIKSDEIWHFYDGTAVVIYILTEDGKLEKRKLGLNINQGELPMIVVPKNAWFAAEVIDKKSFCFVGCTVAPGFDFVDFQLAGKKELLCQFPQHKKLISRMSL